LRRRVVRVERDLDDPRAIAQVDEHETTKVSASVHPSAEADARSDMIESERPTQRVAERGFERNSRTRSGSHRLTPGGIMPRAKRPQPMRGPKLKGALEVSASRSWRGLRR
jgi:hypothetical protein